MRLSQGRLHSQWYDACQYIVFGLGILKFRLQTQTLYFFETWNSGMRSTRRVQFWGEIKLLEIRSYSKKKEQNKTSCWVRTWDFIRCYRKCSTKIDYSNFALQTQSPCCTVKSLGHGCRGPLNEFIDSGSGWRQLF